MARKIKRIPSGDRHQQILKVAMRLFARQGFQGTRTRQIADQAGVNEAILFRHFPKKENLYWAVIDLNCRLGKRQRRLAKLLQADEADEIVFAALAENILQRTVEDKHVLRLLLFSALENHRLSRRFFRTHVAVNHEVLAEHIRRRIRAGQFRRVDPLLAARAFLGMVSNHILIQELLGGEDYRKFDVRKTSAALADIWIRGMRTATKRRIKKSSTKKRRRFKISTRRGG